LSKFRKNISESFLLVYLPIITYLQVTGRPVFGRGLLLWQQMSFWRKR